MIFTLRELSWYKRREPDAVVPKCIEWKVNDFEKVDKHRCTMDVTFDDGNSYTLNARVNVSERYEIQEDGSTNVVYGKWTVQGTNENGVSVLLEIKE